MPLSKNGERYFPDTPKDEKIMVDNMKWMLDAVVDMRKHGILDEGNGKDNAPIVSQDLIGNFINELNYEESHELQWRWMRNEEVEIKYRQKFLKAMVAAIVKTISGDGVPIDDLHAFAFIISNIEPFDRIIFLAGEGLEYGQR